MSPIFATRFAERTRHSSTCVAQRIRDRLPPHHHRRRHRLRGHGYFRRLGPGIVTGAADDDPSGIGTYSQVGARFGYALLWSTLAVAPDGRGGAGARGAPRARHRAWPGAADPVRASGARCCSARVLITVIANTFNVAADVGAMAASTELVTGLPSEGLVIVFTGGMLTLAIVSRLPPVRARAAMARSVVARVPDRPPDGRASTGPRSCTACSSRRSRAAPPGWPHSSPCSGRRSLRTSSSGRRARRWRRRSSTTPSTSRLERSHLVAMRVDVVGGMVSAVAIAFVIMVVAGRDAARRGHHDDRHRRPGSERTAPDRR